jgi:hypothetical protein
MAEIEFAAHGLGPDVLEELERLARAANPSPHHVYTFPRDDDNWKANADFHAAAGPDIVLALIEALRSSRTDRSVTDDPAWIVVKERDLLRQAIVRYGDRGRMGTVEPQELQQAIDDAFEAAPAGQTRFSIARSMIEAGYFDSVHAVAPSLVEEDLTSPVRETPWKWYAGQNDEWFALGPFDTREELLKQAEGERLGEFLDDADGAWKLAFHVVEARSDSLRLADYVDAESLLDQAEECLESSDRMTEVDEGPIFDCSPEERLDLELRIKGACDRWQAVHGMKFHVKSFSHTRNGERVVLSRPIGEKIGSDA